MVRAWLAVLLGLTAPPALAGGGAPEVLPAAPGELLVERPADPVVGGAPADEGRWPDAAALYTASGSFGCTGTLVAPDVVLTAGHCGYGHDRVVLGTIDRTGGGESIGVSEVIVHEDYFTTYDVAVLLLEREATVPPRPLALDCVVLDHLDEGAEVAVVGFGATDPWATEWGTALNEAVTDVVDPVCASTSSGCNAAVSPGGELIAGGDGVDSCNGDSGGPLYLLTDEGDFLMGVTSRAAIPADAPCGDGGIYVRVDAVSDWIEEVSGRDLPRPDCGAFNRAPHPSVVGHIEVGRGRAASVRVEPNDPDPGDTHRFEIASAPRYGAATVDADGRVTYLAPLAYEGPDALTVRVVDDGEPVEQAEVVVDVQVLQTVVTEGPGGCRTATGGPLAALLSLLLVVRWRRR